MEVANKMATLVTRAVNNNAVVNTCLGVSFAVLCVRSMNQETYIETLEAEKDSLTNSNKAIKKTLWDWKQQLFAEASSDSAPVPLSNLKAIYGEITTVPQSGNVVTEKADSPAPEFIIA